MLELTPGTLTGGEVLAELEMWDSLAVISFIALVDERFGVVIEGERLARAVSVEDLITLVHPHLHT
jgi:acyl carrier protein